MFSENPAPKNKLSKIPDISNLLENGPRESKSSLSSFSGAPAKNNSFENVRAKVKDPRKSFTIISNFVRRENIDPNITTKELVSTDPTQQIDENINLLTQIETTKNILCCKYTEDYNFISAGFPDGMVRLFAKNTGQLAMVLYDEESLANAATVTCIKHRPVSKNYPSTNTLLCSYTNGCVKCWDFVSSRCIYTIRERRQTLSLSYHLRLPKFVTCGDDAKIFLYDEETKMQERVFIASDDQNICDGHTSRVFAACFNPRSQFEIVTGGWDNTVQFWDMRAPHATRHIAGVHICAEGIDISPNGRTLLTAAWQKANPFQVWDYNNLKLIQNVKPDPYNAMLYCGRWLDNNYAVCGGCEPNIIRLVDMRTYMNVGAVKNLPGGVYSLDIGIRRKNKKTRGQKADVSSLPMLAYVSGKRIAQIDYC
ncbi:transcription initiation factor TFIID subunit 5-like [Ctenocephalides felis]|uniref:transcription initiation factor TFIID subunit 5-like n=1 Tax=Ctenocephalides felis TaxID=7515 RepID=UPI000E6E2D80|nr:transcription initiation factor TFIID subunit 5-like [Ctenocephalides felis]